jgi:ribulose-phosphate 3-epimerase
MTPAIRIAPSILSADFAKLGEEVRAIEAAGADWVHVDVMDGSFVPNLTIGPPVVSALRKTTELPLDVHLMVERADQMVDWFIDAGSNHVLVHVEADRHLHRTLSRIRERGAKPGVVLNPGTPDAAIESVLHLVDVVLVMSVNPGFGGQRFLPEVLSKVSRIRKWILESNRAVDLAIDGGIDEHTVFHAAKAGANVFIAGSAVFRRESYRSAIAALRERAQAGQLAEVF